MIWITRKKSNQVVHHTKNVIRTSFLNIWIWIINTFWH